MGAQQEGVHATDLATAGRASALIGSFRVSRRGFLKQAGAVAGLAAAGTALGSVFVSEPASAKATWWAPGEGAPAVRIWMAWPSNLTVWGNQLLPKIQGDIAKLAKEVAKWIPVVMCADGATAAVEAQTQCGVTVQVISSIPVDDCWMRDTGPIFRVNDAGGRDAFGLNFNGWGGDQVSTKDNLVAGRVASYAGASSYAQAAVRGEGGGISWDGDGTLMATKSCWKDIGQAQPRNPSLTLKQIEDQLLYRFGATKMLWVDDGVTDAADITDGHIDGSAMFVRPGVVMCQLPPPDRTDVYAEEQRRIYQYLQNATDAKGRSFTIYTMEGPDVLPRWPQNRWDTFFDGYINFVEAGNAIIMGEFGDTPKDAAAKAAVEQAYPGKTVVQLNLDQLFGEGGGGPHCVTMIEPQAAPVTSGARRCWRRCR